MSRGSAVRLLGLQPDDLPVVRRLSGVQALCALGDVLADGIVTSVFLSTLGADRLPLALAGRALFEVSVSLSYARLTRRAPASRALVGSLVMGAALFGAAALALGSGAGIYAAFVVATAVARLRVIHFGVLLLSQLRGAAAARGVPVVYAAARVGAVFAGPLLVFGSHFNPGWLMGLSASLYLSAFALLLKAPLASAGQPGELTDEDVPPSSTLPASSSVAPAQSLLLFSIVLGAVALSVGRLALQTQSGGILEQRYDQGQLSRVLGYYYSAANVIALVLQLSLVGKLLARGGLSWLNSAWAWLYLLAQGALSLGPAWVGTALAARAVESELRNAIRTPVANLLYEAMEPDRRAYARTLVIGVTIPLATLGGGLALGLLEAHPSALAAAGLLAAALIVVTTLLQNRAFQRASGAER